MNRYTPLRGRSYIPLPKFLTNKKAIINVQNNYNKCFLWAVLSALHPADDHSNQVSKYRKWEHEFDEALKGIEFPVKLTDVSKFVKRTNMSINVYCLDNKSIVPLEITKDEKNIHIDLLFYKSHYCWIKDFSRLVRSQITTHTEKIFPCKMCLMKFHSEEKLIIIKLTAVNTNQ
jgi:hypothetical protein